MEQQSQIQSKAPKGEILPELTHSESYIREVKRSMEDIRGDILNALESVDSEKTADSAVHEAAQAIQAGNLSKDQFGKMVDNLPGKALGYVLGSEEAEGLLPHTEPLNTAGMSEYDVEDLDITNKYTPGELNKMPEIPKNKKAA